MSESKPKLDDLRIDRPAAYDKSPGTGPLVGWILVGLLALLLAVWWLRPAKLTVQTIRAQAAPAGLGGERTVLNASGYVTARREATVSSKVTGKVAEILIEEGIKVTEGQVLARLDATNAQASLQLARAQLASARQALGETKVRLREAGQEWDRQKALSQNQVATRAELDHAEAAALAWRERLTQQEADITVAERLVDVWQQQVDDTVIRAPFAGIVTSKNAQPGEMISPMSSGGFTRTGICTIVDMESLEIEIDVNESYINRVAAGQPVEATLDAYPDWKIPGRVIAIIPTADRQKSTVQVRVGFDHLDPRILPEMSVKVAFRDSGPAATGPGGPFVMVPQGTIRNQDGRDVVFVVRAGRIERRAVTVNRTHSGESELSAGVLPGEHLVVDPPADLTDGAPVNERQS